MRPRPGNGLTRPRRDEVWPEAEWSHPGGGKS